MSVSYSISGPKIYTSQGVIEGHRIVVKDKKISEITPSVESHYSFPSHYHLIPGLIDCHVHGMGGHDVMDATEEALSGMREALAKQGVTSFLATTMSSDKADIENALMAIQKFHTTSVLGAKILGIHLEGPFISAKKAGAQAEKFLLNPDIALFEKWQKLSGDRIKLVTLAPELPQSSAFIAYLRKYHIIPSIGHSDATYVETCDAMHQGCEYVTHLFNAMRGIHQREPGVVTAALLNERVWVELIADGIHVHPAVIDMIFRLKNKDKIILVTDAMRATCMPNGRYDLGGQDVHVCHDKAMLDDGTLAGSVLRLPEALKNMLAFTFCDLSTAVNMASKNPAEVLRVDKNKGSIEVGKDADLVVLDENYHVVMTICEGEIVYQKN